MVKLTEEWDFLLDEQEFPFNSELVEETFPDLSQPVEVETSKGERFIVSFQTKMTRFGLQPFEGQEFFLAVTINKTKVA
jgi:hypothetical protein